MAMFNYGRIMGYLALVNVVLGALDNVALEKGAMTNTWHSNLKLRRHRKSASVRSILKRHLTTTGFDDQMTARSHSACAPTYDGIHNDSVLPGMRERERERMIVELHQLSEILFALYCLVIYSE